MSKELKSLGFRPVKGNKNLQEVYIPIEDQDFILIQVEVIGNDWEFSNLEVGGLESTQIVKEEFTDFSQEEIRAFLSKY
jgi:hypothetical protein